MDDIYLHLTQAGVDAAGRGDVSISTMLLRALMLDREPVPEEQLQAEFAVVSEWAHVAEAQHAQLEAVLKGCVRLRVTDGEISLHLTETGRAKALARIGEEG